jgi:hypothetical protein
MVITLIVRSMVRRSIARLNAGDTIPLLVRRQPMYQTPMMLWQEYDRPGAARAFRVVHPAELQGEHWFDLKPVPNGTLVRHTVEGEALGHYEAIWRDRIQPAHDNILEGVLDNIEAELALAPKVKEREL